MPNLSALSDSKEFSRQLKKLQEETELAGEQIVDILLGGQPMPGAVMTPLPLTPLPPLVKKKSQTPRRGFDSVEALSTLARQKNPSKESSVIPPASPPPPSGRLRPIKQGRATFPLRVQQGDLATLRLPHPLLGNLPPRNTLLAPLAPSTDASRNRAPSLSTNSTRPR